MERVLQRWCVPNGSRFCLTSPFVLMACQLDRRAVDWVLEVCNLWRANPATLEDTLWKASTNTYATCGCVHVNPYPPRQKEKNDTCSKLIKIPLDYMPVFAFGGWISQSLTSHPWSNIGIKHGCQTPLTPLSPRLNCQGVLICRCVHGNLHLYANKDLGATWCSHAVSSGSIGVPAAINGKDRATLMGTALVVIMRQPIGCPHSLGSWHSTAWLMLEFWCLVSTWHSCTCLACPVPMSVIGYGSYDLLGNAQIAYKIALLQIEQLFKAPFG